MSEIPDGSFIDLVSDSESDYTSWPSGWDELFHKVDLLIITGVIVYASDSGSRSTTSITATAHAEVDNADTNRDWNARGERTYQVTLDPFDTQNVSTDAMIWAEPAGS